MNVFLWHIENAFREFSYVAEREREGESKSKS